MPLHPWPLLGGWALGREDLAGSLAASALQDM